MNNIHTFVICAYKQSPYLEECIKSLKNQTMPSKIILTTSTPSEWLHDMCNQYQIPCFIRNGRPNISLDWEYALSVTDTEYVTIAHQDDVYEPKYLEKIQERIVNEYKMYHRQPLILFSDYSELINENICIDRNNLKIKRMLLAPLKIKKLAGCKFWKRFVLRFGNAICCPAVTYHVSLIRTYLRQDGRKQLFQKHFRSNVDWETWEWLSTHKGSFVYIPLLLVAHRIHAESETTATIMNHQRKGEDYEMFCKFWPRGFSKFITNMYGRSERSNQIN